MMLMYIHIHIHILRLMDYIFCLHTTYDSCVGRMTPGISLFFQLNRSRNEDT